MVPFLDNDFYNFNMSQYIWTHHKDIRVRYRFINRSPFKILDRVQPQEIELIRNRIHTPMTEKDGEVLRRYGFKEDWLEAISKFDPVVVNIEQGQSEYDIWYEGPWYRAALLETPLLAMLNEAFVRDGFSHVIASRKLFQKLELLERYPYLNIIEFGTRRRANLEWQRTAIQELLDCRPYQVLGTSNVMLADEFGIPGIGTMAHQMFMVCSEIMRDPVSSQDMILWRWEEMFRGSHLTALPDTFGTDFFLRSLRDTVSFNRLYHGLRHDSGDPIEFGHKVIKFWRDNGVDPRDKFITYSDGLNVQKMADIWGQFGTKTNLSFGWGTNLTNDAGVKPISIVIKPEAVSVDGGVTWRTCCKLSDNIEKATGDENTIQRYKKLVGYSSTFAEEAIY